MIPSSENDLSRRCLAEVDDLHSFFVAWLGGAEDADFARCEAAPGPGFQIVEPDGSVIDRDPLLRALGAAKGKHKDAGRPFDILIEESRARTLSDTLCVVTYIERQMVRGRATARRSTALFRRRAGGPNGVEWQHLHETWITAGIATDGEGG